MELKQVFCLQKNGTQRELVTIYTGENDSAKTGIVVNYDGRTSLNIWNTQECNRWVLLSTYLSSSLRLCSTYSLPSFFRLNNLIIFYFRIDGTDGTIYPPAMIHSNSTLYIYSKDLCRKMPLTYSSQYQNRNGIHVMRFRMPKKAFASGHEEKENLCFCSVVSSKFKCLPSGIFNVGPCAFGESFCSYFDRQIWIRNNFCHLFDL